ncbi:threonine dehydratase [Dyella sp. OK004]|uniref:threonine ammonia-lyase n=1 Tax=Dyella sp. OK004 TaxID=1855292 RepID=UPI0008EAC072|nr:pyridoxal-phosphate dependent enzyme [Dyella sp. OK004]SFR94999.1 threonine dehydratase [Dyella sp. OK004]
MPPIADIANILAAGSQIDPVFLDSPLVSDEGLDAALGCQLLAKNETANPIGSFKGRGAELFAATALRSGEVVVCASAGNFGQGLAYAATRRGHACIVFAAKTANPVKIAAMRRLGAEVRLEGADFDAAKQAARIYAAANSLRFVEDGAEPAIAEGAGTIALELHRTEKFDAMLVPLGNGALLEGIGTVLRQLAPATEIIAVVAQNAPAMKRSLEASAVIETASADTIADGIAVRVPIASRLDYLRRCCDSVVAVSEAQIFEAMRLTHRHLQLTVEPAGVVGIAAVLTDPWRFAGRRIATVLCGGNLSDQVRRRLLALA